MQKDSTRATNLFTNSSMFRESVMSNLATLALSLPCLRTKSSSLSCLRPTAMTLEPSRTRRSAVPAPMPDVAPIMRTCLYWKGILKDDWSVTWMSFEYQGYLDLQGRCSMKRLETAMLYTRFLSPLVGVRRQDIPLFDSALPPVLNILHTALSIAHRRHRGLINTTVSHVIATEHLRFWV